MDFRQFRTCPVETHLFGKPEDLGFLSWHELEKPAMSFWKKNSKTVPGWPSPSKEKGETSSSSSWTKPRSSSASECGTSSFQDFHDSVRDAWDVDVVDGDDISKEVAQSTALSVINSHRSGGGGESGPLMKKPASLSLQQPDVHRDHKSKSKLEKSKSIPISCVNVAKVKESSISSSGQSATVNAANANIEIGIGSAECNKPESSDSSNVNVNLPNGNCEIPLVPHGGGDPQNIGKLSCSKPQPRVINRFESEGEKVKADKIRGVLQGPGSTGLKDLQSLSYSGLPASVRGTTWRLLAGYLPANIERRDEALRRKREEYWKCVQQYYDSRKEECHQDTFRQIHIDIPRMCPLIALFQQRVVQEMFEKILFIWAIRHPASGYVQGMNDLVTPFFVVFLEEVLPPEVEVESFDVSRLGDEVRNNIEADSYWCMSKFLDSIQVNYIFAQTGIQEKVKRLKELIERIDAPLHHHLQQHDIDYLQFSFRWMNNLLMRELPLRCTIRLWDTYLSEPDGCGSVLLYVCAAFLRHWRDQLIKQKDFQGLMLLLQNLPTQNWESSEISLIVAEAYRLKYTYDNTHWH